MINTIASNTFLVGMLEKETGSQVKPSRIQCWLELVGNVLLFSLLYTFVAEIVYSKNQGWGALALSAEDNQILIGLLFNQPLLLMVPVLTLSGILILFRQTQWAQRVTAGASGLAFTWLGINLYTLMVTGNHVQTYLQYLGDSDALAMGGGGQLVFTLLLILSVLFILIIGMFRLIKAIIAKCYPHRFPAMGGIFTAALTGLLLYLAVTPINLAESTERPLLVMRLTEALPIPLPFTSLQERLLADPSEVLREINRGLDVLASEYGPKLAMAPSAQPTIELPLNQKKNVILIVLESLRHDSFDTQWMPKVAAWAKTGLQLRHHYASTNTSHLGFFALLYGRSPLAYQATLDAKHPSALAATLRQAGYRSTFLAGTSMNWQRMDEYLSPWNFDEITIDEEGTWFERDQRSLARIQEMSSNENPQLLVVHLNSSHFPYKYPAEFQHFQPAASLSKGSYARAGYGAMQDSGPASEEFRQAWLNRYHNALRFLDDRLAQLLVNLDPEKNIVVLTGDHGESFYDDETWLHSSRQSDIQTMVPMTIKGANIPPGERDGRTSHLDIVPTLLHALGASPQVLTGLQGHDLLKSRMALKQDAEEGFLLVNFSASHLALLFRNQRLHIKVDEDRSSMYSLGFQDTNADFLSLDQKLSEPPHLWVNAIRHQLELVTR